MSLSLPFFATADTKNSPVSTEEVAPSPSAAPTTPEARMTELEASLDRLEAEVEILKTQNRMVIERTALVFNNSTYLKGGLSLILPRERSFGMQTDTGIGAFGGIGQYFGRNHVLELALEWDYYPSAALRYRYEFHQTSPLITFGPVIGYKMKLAGIRPFDNFIENPALVKSSFFLIGAMFGIPMTKSLIVMEILYVTNTQSAIHANCAIHFFL